MLQKNQVSSQHLLTKSLDIAIWSMKCAHLKYYVNTMATSREILFCTPLAYKPDLENLTFISFIWQKLFEKKLHDFVEDFVFNFLKNLILTCHELRVESVQFDLKSLEPCLSKI